MYLKRFTGPLLTLARTFGFLKVRHPEPCLAFSQGEFSPILGTICRFLPLAPVRGAVEIAPMTACRPRSSYESDWLPYTKVTGRSAVRAAIGEELKRRFAVLQPVPQEMLALLVQVNALREDDGQ